MLVSLVLLSVLAIFVAAGDKTYKISRVKKEENLIIYDVKEGNVDIWFSFFQMFGFSSVRINSTADSKKADFRLTPIRIIEFSEKIPIESSQSVFNFEGNQHNWSGIKVEEIKEVIDQKTTNIVRMNATMTAGQLTYTMNVYLTDRSCFYGNLNLDPNGAYIVQTIKGFPYKYSNSSIAVEQVVASRDSGTIGTFVALSNSPFLGSLIISPEAYDKEQGKLPISTSDFAEITFNLTTSTMVRESDFERVYVAIGSDQQPKDVSFDEKFSVNVGSVKKDGFDINTGTGGGNKNTGNYDSGEASEATSVKPMFLVFAFTFLYLIF